MKRIALALAMAGVLAGARAPQDETARNRAVVEDFARLFYAEKNVRAAFEKYVVEDYIQHNPNIADGREAAIAALEPKFSSPTARFTIKRIMVDRDHAVIHLHGQPDPASRGGAVADFYRLKDGMIVEHWDVLQPVPEHAANPHPMF